MRNLITFVALVLLSSAVLAQQVDNGGGERPKELEGFKKTIPGYGAKVGHYSQEPTNRAMVQSVSSNRGTTLSQVAAFPFQEPYTTFRSYYESCPLVLGNGNLLVAYGNPSLDTLYSVKSTDGGSTWGSPACVVSSQAFHALSGVRTAQGRIIIVAWTSTLALDHTNYGLSICSSDDDGVTWSAAKPVTNEAGDNYTTLSQTLDGTIWLCYSRYDVATAYDSYFRSSTNNGDTWSDEKAIASTSSSEIYATIVSKDSLTCIAVVADNSSGNFDIYEKTSTDGGTTWSTTSPVANTSTTETRPRVLRQTDGTLWLLYQHYRASTGGFTQSEIAYKKSNDSGATWSATSYLTNYAGYDGWFNACMVANQPFVTFASYRWCVVQSQTHLWYGLVGASTDNNTPPTLTYYSNSVPAPESTISILAYVDDEVGMSSVQLSYHLNGFSYGPFQMYDDGLHGDNAALDRIYGTTVGPFHLGDLFDFSIDLIDVNANQVNIYANGFALPAVHNAGNIVLKFSGNSELGDVGISRGYGAYWPKEGGYDYLYDGGLWVGCNVGGENLVVKYFYGMGTDWYRTYATPFTLSAGISNQDGDVTYDDTYSLSPIGLRVHQQSYQWSNSTRQDFIIFSYTITNKGPNSVLNNIYAGLWTDPDVAFQTNPGSNAAGYDSQRHMLYAYNTQNTPTGYFGVKLLGAGTVPSTAYSWLAGQLDELQNMPFYQCLTKGGTTLPDSAGDVRMLLTASPFSLALNASVKVMFGIVLGNGLAELQAHADTMEAIFESLPTSVDQASSKTLLPREFSLSQNHPNPFNPSTTIHYTLPEQSRVRLTVYNVLGQVVTDLVNSEQAAGWNQVLWNANVASGLYFCRMEAVSVRDPNKRFLDVKKMILLK